MEDTTDKRDARDKSLIQAKPSPNPSTSLCVKRVLICSTVVLGLVTAFSILLFDGRQEWSRTTNLKLKETNASIFMNANKKSTLNSCIMLANPVNYHSEVQIAFHSYLLEAGFAVCLFDEIKGGLGYTNWFTPATSTSLVLSDVDFWALRAADSPRLKPLILLTLPPDTVHTRTASTEFNNAIVVIHHPKGIPAKKASKEKWTLAFLSPRVEQVWKNSTFTKPNNPLRESPSVSFVAVWRGSTSLSRNPIIHIAAHDKDLPTMLDWKAVVELLDTPIEDWHKNQRRLMSRQGLALGPRLQMKDLQSWRYVVVQGRIEPGRRDYKSLFEWLVRSQAASHPKFKLVLVGYMASHPRDLSLDIIINHGLQDKVVIVPNCKHIACARVIEGARLLFPCHKKGDMSYTDLSSSSSIPTALSYGVPIVGDERVGLAYGEIVSQAVIEYADPDISNTDGHVLLENGLLTDFSAKATQFIDLHVPLETFEEAVSLMISLDESTFDGVRRKVLEVRDSIIVGNTNRLVELVHQTQVH